MADLTILKPGHAEMAFPTGDVPVAGGDAFLNDGVTMLRFTNTTGGSITVTVVAQRASNYGYVTNVLVTVPATTGDVLVGPFPPDRFNDNTGKCQLTYSAAPTKAWAISAGGSVLGG